MRVGINAFALRGQYAGIGVYLKNMLLALQRIDRRNEYFLYVPGPVNTIAIPDSRWRMCVVRGPANVSQTVWMQVSAKSRLLRDKIDLFWSPSAIVPLSAPRHVRVISTVLDLTWKYYPRTLAWDNRIILPFLFPRSLEAADRIITISETAAADLKKDFPSIAEKVSTVYLGPGSIPLSLLTQNRNDSDYLAQRFQLCGPYLLTVSSIEPRKNLGILFAAYAQLRKQKEHPVPSLVIVGKKGWKTRKIFEAYRSLNLGQKDVRFTGYVSENDLAVLYRNAAVFVFVSLYEGFGLTPLEAMAAGVPAVVSDIPVFREILSPAPLFVNPHVPQDIALAVERILGDLATASRLRQRGLERVAQFSWEKAAHQTLAVFETAMG